jgi:hypothetical protein
MKKKKITQIWVITICVVLDHNTVIFQKEKGVHIKITGMQDSNSQDTNVERNKNVALNGCP